MIIDSEAQMLYVFGGRIIDVDADSPKYAGFYRYSIFSRDWSLLQYDFQAPLPFQAKLMMQRQPDVTPSSSGLTISPRSGNYVLLSVLLF
jgi:hypothetical protein